MEDTSRTNKKLLEEISALKQKIQKLEQSESEWQKEKEELKKSEARFRSYFDLPLHGIAITSPEKGWIQVNDRICSILGYSRDEIVRMTWSEMTHPDDLAADLEQFSRILSGQIDQYNMEKRFIRKNGTVVWTRLSVGCVRKPDGSVDHTIALLEDITSSKQAEEELKESEERHRLFIESIPIGLYRNTIGPHGRFIMVNTALARLHGYDSVNEFLSRDVLDLYVDPAQRKEVSAELVEKGFISGKEVRLKRKDGTPIWGSITARAIRDREGKVMYFDGNVTDITDRKRMEEKILALSVTDQLTGLYNRRGFLFHAEQQLKLSERNKSKLLLFFADLDSLKWINDSLGHEEGDKALIESANILKETFRTSDIIARLGGDEFAILAIDIDGVNPEVFTARLQKLINIWNNQENRKYKLSISIGCAYYDPEKPSSIDDLIARADKLMYEQKQNKKSLLL